ncbi:MAG: zinc ribbon domain-containing protein [Oscillospiraceae bacterium]|nr:zinc ribbon domain-containing protein [Oscillospiraceae bacterium]
MLKTKLGISVGLFGAALYFIGLLDIIPLTIIAGYTLLCEENEWLKKTAVKALAIVIFFSVVSAFIGLLSNSSSFLNDVVMLFKGSIDLSWLNRITSILRTVLSFMQTLVLLTAGFKALSQKTFNLIILDGVLNKHLQKNSEQSSSVKNNTAAPEQNIQTEASATVKFCKNCGTKIKEDSTFCGECGTPAN